MSISVLMVSASSLFLSMLSGTSLDVPSLTAIEEAINASPKVMAAEAEVERARATARRYRVGEYEIELSGAGIERSVDEEGEFTEWTGGLTRQVRWPDKQRTDRQLARIEVEIAAADLANAHFEMARQFMDLWREWRMAKELVQHKEEAARDAQDFALAETRRVELGAGRAVDRDQADSDAALAKIALAQARLRAGMAEAALLAAFPAYHPSSSIELALPPRNEISLSPLVSPAVQAARLRLEQQELTSKRTRMNRRPDPTVGLQAFSERDGAETGLGVTLSIPLTGRARDAAADEARARIKAEAVALHAAELEAARQIQTLNMLYNSSYLAAEIAEDAAKTARSALTRIEKGREVGAVTVTELIAARTTWRAAEEARIKAVVEAQAAHLIMSLIPTTPVGDEPEATKP